jgi:hypothetical protein
MGVHWVQKGITGQAVDATSAGHRIANISAAITADNVVAGISGMRWVIDPELGVVEHIEPFHTELEIPLAKNIEVF